MDYNELVGQMLEHYHDMVGEVAYTQAKRVEGLEIDDEGNARGDITADTIEEMVDVFQEVIGEGSVGVARKAVKEAYQDDKSVADLDIPERIEPKELKAEEFASAL